MLLEHPLEECEEKGGVTAGQSDQIDGSGDLANGKAEAVREDEAQIARQPQSDDEPEEDSAFQRVEGAHFLKFQVFRSKYGKYGKQHTAHITCTGCIQINKVRSESSKFPPVDLWESVGRGLEFGLCNLSQIPFLNVLSGVI